MIAVTEHFPARRYINDVQAISREIEEIGEGVLRLWRQLDGTPLWIGVEKAFWTPIGGPFSGAD